MSKRMLYRPMRAWFYKNVPRAGILTLHSIRSMSQFHVEEHIVRTQHIRERYGAVEPGMEHALRLSVKQYTPKDNMSPRPGDVTIIGAHATGFPKEIYEPLWIDLYYKMKQSGRRIRGIWIADVAHHGQSGILNERILGNDPSWWDHARDLLFLINKYQDQMPSPLIGIGHSMGGMQLAHLSLIHPSLFQALILIDPVIQRWNPGKNFALLSTYRRDIWPSRSQAAMKFMSSPFFQRWDPRVLERWIEYGLRELPTEIYPEPVQTDEKPVTLTTTKAQEVFTFLRPAYRDDKRLGEDCTPKTEMYPEDIEDDPFYRPEAPRLFRRLPELRPSVMYLFGQNSELSTPEDRQLKMDLTGTGPGGSGGAINGRVQQTALPCGHLIPMEMVTESAKVCTSFIDQELCRWEMQMKRNQQQWEKYSRHDRLTIDERWKENIGQPAGRSTRARDPKT